MRFVDPGFALGKPIVELPRSLQFKDSDSPLPPFFLSGTTTEFPFLQTERKIDLLAGLKLEWESSRKYETIRMVLGAAEVGAVTYLAYRYLKKYGLK